MITEQIETLSQIKREAAVRLPRTILWEDCSDF